MSQSSPAPSARPQPSTKVGALKKKGAVSPPALRPEESLAPLAQIFSKSGSADAFQADLCEYVRALIGAQWAVIFESVAADNIRTIAATPGVGRIPEVDAAIGKAFSSFSSQRKDVMINRQQHVVLAVPFRLKDSNPIAMAVALPPARVAYAEPCFTILHLATQFLVQRNLLEGANENEGAFNQATLLVEMISRTQERETFQRSVFTLAAELEKFFDCDRIAIGVKTNRGCRVETVSGMTDDKLKNLGTSQLGSALTEAMSIGRMTVWPRQENLPDDVAISASHDDLMRSFQVDRMLVTPLFEAELAGEEDERTENPIGAIALLWSGSDARHQGIQPYTFNLLRACRPHLSALTQLLRRSKPGRVGSAMRKAFGGTFAKKLGLFCIGALVSGTMIFPIEYRVSADCKVIATSRRTVAALVDSRLERSNVKPGDLVEKGQIIAELNDYEIRVQLNESIASQNAALKKRDDAMVRKIPSEIHTAQLEANRLAMEVGFLRSEIEKLLIRSPIDGVVLTGNLERSAGVPVATGQKLFEIAPLDEMLVEMYVPETEVRHIEKGRTAYIKLEGKGTDKLTTTLDLIHPVAELEQGENVFVGEALLKNEDESLSPGMRGKARIEAGKKPIGWIIFHRLYEYLRLKLW